MALVEEHLRSQVLRGPTKGVCFSSTGDYLCKAEVCEFEVAVLLDENVLGLEIAVDDILRVKVLEHGDDLRRIES